MLHPGRCFALINRISLEVGETSVRCCLKCNDSPQRSCENPASTCQYFKGKSLALKHSHFGYTGCIINYKTIPIFSLQVQAVEMDRNSICCFLSCSKGHTHVETIFLMFLFEISQQVTVTHLVRYRKISPQSLLTF